MDNEHDDEHAGLRLLFNARYPLGPYKDGRQDDGGAAPPPDGDDCDDR